MTHNASLASDWKPQTDLELVTLPQPHVVALQHHSHVSICA